MHTDMTKDWTQNYLNKITVLYIKTTRSLYADGTLMFLPQSGFRSVFWVVAPHSLVGGCVCYKETCCIHR
jgi:hypothetical protein